MAETTTITITVPVTIAERLNRLADLTERDQSSLATDALEIYTRYELEIVEGILEGLEDVKAGRVVPHEQVMAEVDAIIEAARVRKAKGAARKRAGAQ